MRVVIVGLGNQGQKWSDVVGDDEVVAWVDPEGPTDYSDIKSVPLDSYEAAIVCTPNLAKAEIIQYLILNNKHVLVEKPLPLTPTMIQRLGDAAEDKRLVLQTSYNLRFEPNVQRVGELLQTGELGKIYHCKMLYGYGTAQDVKGTWRDQGLGVVPEVASHLFDLVALWFGEGVLAAPGNVGISQFEVNSFDRVRVSFEAPESPLSIDLEASWVCWANRFLVDIYAEHGSVHIDGLLKWGCSKFCHHIRRLPSGMPIRNQEIISAQTDKSLLAQYLDFKKMINLAASDKLVLEDLDRDIVITSLLNEIFDQINDG